MKKLFLVSILCFVSFEVKAQEVAFRGCIFTTGGSASQVRLYEGRIGMSVRDVQQWFYKVSAPIVRAIDSEDNGRSHKEHITLCVLYESFMEHVHKAVMGGVGWVGAAIAVVASLLAEAIASAIRAVLNKYKNNNAPKTVSARQKINNEYQTIVRNCKIGVEDQELRQCRYVTVPICSVETNIQCNNNLDLV